jgi:F0F1-type ATP synthase assembly protein I
MTYKNEKDFLQVFERRSEMKNLLVCLAFALLIYGVTVQRGYFAIGGESVLFIGFIVYTAVAWFERRRAS